MARVRRAAGKAVRADENHAGAKNGLTGQRLPHINDPEMLIKAVATAIRQRKCNQATDSRRYDRSKHLLVIEDEQKLGDYLHKGLSESGFNVDLSRDGTEGSATRRNAL